MRIWNLELKWVKHGHEFSQEEYDRGLEIRKLNSQLKLENKKMEILESQLRTKSMFEDFKEIYTANSKGGDGTDAILLQLLSTVFLKNSQAQPANQSNLMQFAAPQAPTAPEISDEALEQIINSIPATARAAMKVMPEATLIDSIKTRYPQIDEATIKRGVAKIKN